MTNMPKKSLPRTLGTWEQLLAGVAANQGELPHVDVYRAQLDAEITDVRAAQSRRSALQAESLQATQDLRSFAARGNDLAVRIRAGIVLQYGPRSEKLVEFGMKPNRKRRGAKEKPVPKAKKGAPRKPAKTVR
jgi:transcription elongation GreA/GreB family factor